MRFFQNGPSIPDDLLIARDEGRVVFFCGAGVSRARAGLSDFFGLAGDVIRRLGVPSDNPACKLLSEAREIDKRTGVSGVISADRIFGLLERDFLTSDIEGAVAQALQPPPDVNLSAHQILLDLATTPEGLTRLVTTNFDRLFEDCNASLQVSQPPRLPDPSRPNDLDGVIHLHGRTNKGYSGSEGDGFVLSSSEFGRAYLSDGWATSFFREIVNRYVVVFVGYGADDPPVQYLLEALNKKAGRLSGVYAFQEGTSSEASARWHHKGIKAIAYLRDDTHRELWKTLEAWAERARAPEQWYKTVIDLAGKGPNHLKAHERGQVAHVVSTLEGARVFSEGDLPPPAEWLCVFDPYQRYSKPGELGRRAERGPYVDPFDLYGLDNDAVPRKIDPEDYYAKREVPQKAWDGLAANKRDGIVLEVDTLSSLRGPWAANSPTLPSRLRQLGIWISKVANQPASVWWAAHQSALHPFIQEQIQWQLERSQQDFLPVLRQAWRYLFEAWEEKRENSRRDWHELEAVIRKDGWDSATVRRYAAISRPYLNAKRSYWGGPTPPQCNQEIRFEDLLQLDVEYPDLPNNFEIPDKYLALSIREARKNLELALILETELGGYGLRNLVPIVSDETPDADHYRRTHGLSAYVISFSSLFIRLLQADLSAAEHEFAAWLSDDDTIFARLRIWAFGQSELISAQALGPLIISLSDSVFWDRHHQRDLLLVLAARWEELSDETRKKIEERLLEGPSKWRNEEEEDFKERRAWESLNRIAWLANSGCEYTFNLARETEKLRSIVPDWKPEYGTKAATSMEGRVGWVRTDTEHSVLLTEPLSSLLSKAMELSGRSEDFFVERNPFAGFSSERPIRAFAALSYAARQNEYPEWAWTTFLNSEARKNDKPRFISLIAERVARYPNKAVVGFIRSISDWLSNISKTLAAEYPTGFDKIVSKIVNVLRLQPPESTSAIVRTHSEPDWTMEAINSPVGKVAQALFDDPRKDGLEAGKGFRAGWLAHVNDLISLGGDQRRYAFVIFAYNLGWFYTIDPNWTEVNLISILNSEEREDREALLSGFLWAAKLPSRELFMRMKPFILALAKERSSWRRGYREALAGLILASWGSVDEKAGDRWISTEEIRDVLLYADDEFRSQIIWHAENWSKLEGDLGEKWLELLLELLRNVWPRQISTRTPSISARLCDLVFSDVERFPKISKIILPLLTTIDHDYLMIPGLRKKRDSVVDLYPSQTLEILHAVLPEKVRSWPHNIQEILERIGQADSTLKSDERLLELKRKWNAR